ncbi:MAG: hypothetical protein GXO74_15055 [Calditrichaeota bacterium]|nr:hypothetical protein [Calditrichota bacterium]
MKPLRVGTVLVVDSDSLKLPHLNDWSVHWRGSIVAPVSGEFKFSAATDFRFELIVDDKRIIDRWKDGNRQSGSIRLQAGKFYPIEIKYGHNGGDTFFQLFWEAEGLEKQIIPASAFHFSRADEKLVSYEFRKKVWKKWKRSNIGFRVVMAPLPKTKPIAVQPPFVRQCVKSGGKYVVTAPQQPYFRKRYLLPIPPDNTPPEENYAVGLSPIFRPHNHSPGLIVFPNGDVMAVFFSAIEEDEPEVSLIACRLRFGADQWDMPSPFLDFPDANDVAPLLWNDGDSTFLFWANLHLRGTFPFQWIVTHDNGASWSEVQYPKSVRLVAPYTPQPITSAFRDRNGTMYVACDGLGPTSLLWTSEDNGKTWYDTGGRTGARHTAFVLLKDGTIFGMGGKEANIDGYMPISMSRDRGKNWRITKSEFPALGSNQRPTMIRLQSGRLFLAADFQRSDGFQPPGISRRGAYVALSDDEGKTWRIKPLPGVQLHERPKKRALMRGGTLGYPVARQAPNGMIHLITTMNEPCLHFEFNEAWILSDENPSQDEIMKSTAKKIARVQRFEEYYADGKLKAIWHGGVGDDGRFLLHGNEVWFYPNGKKQWEVTYELGNKIGRETFWDRQGKILWQWEHHRDGSAVWTQFWKNGNKKSESHWKNKRAVGRAQRWNRQGKLILDKVF